MIVTPLPADLAQRVADVDERIRLLYDPSVLPPSRWPGDVTGDPGFERDPAGERRWAELLADADVLFGIPGNSGTGLVETLRAAPRVRWVQAGNAGAGEQLGAALALEPALVRDVTVTSVVTLPLTDDTRGLVDRATLAALRPGAVVVNVGRGPVVDEAALVDTLRGREIAGACLDMFAEEPLPADSPLWLLDNVILSRQVAARTDDEDDRAVGLFADNLRRHLDGTPLRNRVDPGRLY
jgi:hypothetical protein